MYYFQLILLLTFVYVSKYSDSKLKIWSWFDLAFVLLAIRNILYHSLATHSIFFFLILFCNCNVSLLPTTVPIMYRYTVLVVNREPVDYPTFWCNGLEGNSQAHLHFFKGNKFFLSWYTHDSRMGRWWQLSPGRWAITIRVKHGDFRHMNLWMKSTSVVANFDIYYGRYWGTLTFVGRADKTAWGVAKTTYTWAMW